MYIYFYCKDIYENVGEFGVSQVFSLSHQVDAISKAATKKVAVM